MSYKAADCATVCTSCPTCAQNFLTGGNEGSSGNYLNLNIDIDLDLTAIATSAFSQKDPTKALDDPNNTKGLSKGDWVRVEFKDKRL